MYVSEEELFGEQYTVWVEGTEVNDYHFSKQQAEHLSEVYKEHGHTDVQVQRVSAND